MLFSIKVLPHMTKCVERRHKFLSRMKMNTHARERESTTIHEWEEKLAAAT